MKNIYFLIISSLYLLTMCNPNQNVPCISDFPDSLFIQIEHKANIYELTDAEIDNYFEKYPGSDYLLSLKVSFYTEEQELISAEKIINDWSMKFENRGTFYYWSVGRIQFIKDELELAKDNLLKSIDLDSNNVNRYVYLDLYYLYKVLKDPKEAKNCIDKALEIDSNFIDAKFLKADLYKELSMSKEYIDEIQSIQKYTFVSEAYAEESYFYLENGQINKAVEVLNRSLTIKENPEAYCGLGFIEEANGNYENALSYYLKALDIDSESGTVHNRLGHYYFESGQLELSYEHLLKSYKYDKESEDLLYVIRTLMLMESYEDAERYIQEYLNNYQAFYDIDFYKTLLYFKQGKIREYESSLNSFFDNYSH